MLINGQPVLTDHVPSIIEQLQKLPRGVQQTATLEIQMGHYLGNVLPVLAEYSMHAARGVIDPKLFEQCCREIHNELSHCSPSADPARASHLYKLLGQLYEDIGDKERMIHNFHESLRLAKRGDERYVQAFSGPLLYTSVLNAIEDRSISPEQAKPILEECRQAMYWLTINGPHYEDAFHNAQALTEGEYGISNKEDMSTDSVGECGLIVLRDPKTCWTSMAHIDRFIAADKYDAVLDGRPTGPMMPLLNASLAGLCENDMVKSGGAQRTILANLIKFMLPHNINVVSAYILNETGVGNYVTRPETGEMIEGIGTKGYERALFTKIARNCTGKTESFLKAFNLIETKEVKPCLITGQQARSFILYMNNSPEKKVFDDFVQHFTGNSAWAIGISHTEQCLRFMDANTKASKEIAQTVEMNLAGMYPGEESGRIHALTNAVPSIYVAPKYIGEGSREENAPLVDMISTHLPVRNFGPQSLAQFQRRVASFEFKS